MISKKDAEAHEVVDGLGVRVQCDPRHEAADDSLRADRLAARDDVLATRKFTT